MLRKGDTRFTSGTSPTKYTYTGQYSHTGDFGLMFYNARWYDPSLGRFTSADSIVPAGVQGYDRYAYVNNNPVKYTDPSGHCSQTGDDWCFDDKGGDDGITITYTPPAISSKDKSIIPGLPSGQDACSFFFSGGQDVCNFDYSLLLAPSIPYSIPSLIDYSLNGMTYLWDAYTLNAIGIGGNITGGAGLLQSGAGIDALYLLEDRSVVIGGHAGPSPGIGASLSPSANGIIGFNIDSPSDYTGGGQEVDITFAYGLEGIRIGYFWPAFHLPLQPNDPQGIIIGLAGGAAASGTYSAHAYYPFYQYDFNK